MAARFGGPSPSEGPPGSGRKTVERWADGGCPLTSALDAAGPNPAVPRDAASILAVSSGNTGEPD